MKAGDLINHTYRILNPIGHGGIGTIYLAYHENLRKYVVVKKIHDRMVSLVNCRSEVDILKGLHHRFLPQVYDFLELEEGIFTVMDYISGHDLKFYMDQGYAFDDACLVLWLEQLCDVLEYLHSYEIIHCDIKPANIMITDRGDICLIDFNISLDGKNNKDLVGVSSQYAAPEQIKKARLMLDGLPSGHIVIDARSDLYSAGAVFYHMMSGLMPKERRENQIRLKDMALPYDSAIVNIIDKCMMTDPGRRFKSARSILEALGQREKWSSQWRRMTLVSRIGDGIFLTLFITAVCMMIAGYQQDHREDFFSACQAYISREAILYSPGQEEKAVEEYYQQGIDLLNQHDFEKLFSQYSQEKANVLYCTGKALMAVQDYSMAKDYLKEAGSLDGDNYNIFRDLAICQAWEEDYDQARESLNRARYLGLPDTDGALVEGQIAYMQEDYAAAYDMAVAAAEGDDVERQAAVLAVISSEALGNYGECLDFVLNMAGRSGGAARYLWLQKGGELCVIALSQDTRDQSNAAASVLESDADFQEKGISCYEELMDGGFAVLSDLYNLVFLYESAGRLFDCRDLLADMFLMYPQEYKICAQQAYVYYRIENDRPIDQRDYTQVKECYDRAVALCRESGEEPSEDADIVQLEMILEDLQEKGWLMP